MVKQWKLTKDGFYLNKPYLFRGLYNFLSNNNYGLKISHLGDGYSSTIIEPRVIVSNYDFWAPIKGRFIYIVDDGVIWNPSFYPVKTKLDKYECLHAPGYTRYNSIKKKLRVQHTIFLPEKDSYEISLIEIENLSKKIKNIKIFTLAEFLLYETQEVDPVYYSWFTDSKLKDNKTLIFFKLYENPIVGFYKSLNNVSGYDASLKEFLGDSDIHLPEVVRNGKSRNSNSGGDPYIGSFQYNLKLQPGMKKYIALFMGVGENTLSTVNKKYKKITDVKNEFNIVKDIWKKRLYNEKIDNSKFSGEISSYLKTFFPYQIYQQSLGLVRGVYRGFRDVAQDAMGLSYFDKEGSKKIILDMCKRQFKNGRCLRQWHTGGGFNDERDFRDLPIWIVVSVSKYIENTGDSSILEEKIAYFDSNKTATIYEHIVQGIKYVLRYGKHSLLKIGEGDWNDALSGLGKNGESLWLSEFAYFGLSKLEWINQRFGYNNSIKIKQEKKKLYNGVIKNWAEKWFIRGYTEKGDVIGGHERIYLLPQAWFVISGMYKNDINKAIIAIKNMIKRLDNENGFLLCYPAFNKYDEKVGHLSALAPGVAENYAVYNHASAFGILSLLELGLKKEADYFLKKLLPINKNIETTKSEPYVFVNYYNGGIYKNKKGTGGIPWLTSTVSWFAIILFEKLLKNY